jgi:hypothetical protein
MPRLIEGNPETDIRMSWVCCAYLFRSPLPAFTDAMKPE